MPIQTVIFLLLSASVLILIVLNAFLIWHFYRKNKEISEFWENGKIKNLKDIFLSQKEKNKDLEKQIESAFLKIKDLEDISEITIKKVGIVRFNPFNDIGGNQSFAIALLDNKNNGFLISSLFLNDGNRVYAKAIKNAKSDNPLLEAEREAINKAVNS